MINFFALTQESKEELAAYEKVGPEKASHFTSLKGSGWQIGIETGNMFKLYVLLHGHNRIADSFPRYQLRHDVTSLPHLYVLSKSGKYIWHGHPLESGLEAVFDKALDEHRPKQSKHKHD